MWKSLLEQVCSGNSSNITIVGAQLPCDQNSTVTELVTGDASSFYFFDFENLCEFKHKVEKLVEGKQQDKNKDFIAFAKCAKDNFPALDAVLLKKEK